MPLEQAKRYVTAIIWSILLTSLLVADVVIAINMQLGWKDADDGQIMIPIGLAILVVVVASVLIRADKHETNIRLLLWAHAAAWGLPIATMIMSSVPVKNPIIPDTCIIIAALGTAAAISLTAVVIHKAIGRDQDLEKFVAALPEDERPDISTYQGKVMARQMMERALENLESK